jgi:hypothetical protein
VTDEKKPPPDEYSAFRKLLDGIAKVPKKEIDKKEQEYQQEREGARKKRQV